MNCNTFTEQLTEYVEQGRTPEMRDLMTLHTRSCTACRGELDQMVRLQDRLLQDGRIPPAVGLSAKVLEEIRHRDSVGSQNSFWGIIMEHKVAAFSLSAACVAVVATIGLMLVHPDDTVIAQSPAPTTFPIEEPTTLPMSRGGAGARVLEQRVVAAQAVVRVIVQQVGEPRPGGDVGVHFRVTRVLYGKLPGTSLEIRVGLPESMVQSSGAAYAVGKEQIVFLNQLREVDGRIVARQLGANYDSAPGRLDEAERQIAAIANALAQSKLPERQQRIVGLELIRGSVDRAEVILAGTLLDVTPVPGDLPGFRQQYSRRLRIERTLKGEFRNQTITIQEPMAPEAGEIGQEWIIMLSPEFLAGQQLYAARAAIRIEPQLRAYLAGDVDALKGE